MCPTFGVQFSFQTTFLLIRLWQSLSNNADIVFVTFEFNF